MRLSTFFSVVYYVTSVFAAFDLNRAGAVVKTTADDPFATVTGTFTVPNLSGSSRLSIWVGIGDSTSQTYVLGGGILYNSSLSTWSAFFPSEPTSLTSEVPVQNGDSMTVTVSIEAGAGGNVTLENITQNKKSIQTVPAPTNADPAGLTAMAADWWVQAYQVTEGELVTTPSFGIVSFTECSATTQSGNSVPLTEGGAYEIQGTSGQMYSQTTLSDSGLTVERQG